MNNFNFGRANQVRSIDSTKEREIQLWYWQLRYPSFEYMKYLFLDLFISINIPDLKCETCVYPKVIEALILSI